MPSSGFEHLVGHRFAGGTYDLPEYECWLWADAIGAMPDPLLAHPGIAYMVGLHGGGASIQDVFDLLEADQDSGVLFGEIDLRFHRPLLPGASYAVTGQIDAVERKRGRKAGVFDRVSFTHEIREQAGQPAVDVHHVWIFPRREAEAA